MATNNAINSNIPIEIAKGGTNATSMSTSTGIVKYDGTSLVTSSTALIDSSNRYTNTSQPAFQAYLALATSNNVTGDGTTYQVICGTELFDVGNNYDNSTGVFTAPVAGKYMFTWACMAQNIGASHNTLQLVIRTPTQDFQGSYCSAAACRAGGNFLQVNMMSLANLSANDQVSFLITVAGSTKTIGINGGGARPAQQFTYCSGYLVC